MASKPVLVGAPAVRYTADDVFSVAVSRAPVVLDLNVKLPAASAKEARSAVAGTLRAEHGDRSEALRAGSRA